MESIEWFEKRLARVKRRLELVSRKPNTPAEEVQGLRDKEQAYQDAISALTAEARLRAYIKHLEARCL